jgi:hypothetical protein
VESTSGFEGMPTGMSLLQSHPTTLSKLICSPAPDIFMKTLSNLKKYIFIPTASQTALRKPPRALKECQEGCQLYRTHSNFIENK